MPISHETVVFDVHDFKVYTMLSDSASSSPTFGAAIDVPGISDVSLEPNLVTAELAGDARIIARRGRTDRFRVSATYSKIQMDVLACILGGSVSDIGSGPTAETRYELYSPASLPYFKAEFLINDVDVGLGTIQFILFKCQLTGGTLLSQSTDNFGKPTITLEGIQPDFAGVPMGRVRLLQTLTPLDP
jgi:hypothetical protein